MSPFAPSVFTSFFRCCAVGLLAGGLFGATTLSRAEGGSEFTAWCAQHAVEPSAKSDRVIAGAVPGWLFLRTELKHLATGAFWEDTAALPNGDPLATIVAYHRALKELGVTLVVVPVPAKAALYPDKLVAGVEPDACPAVAPWFEKLAAAGVLAVDLVPLLRNQREIQKVYCEQDAHWTPWACRVAADAVSRLPEVRELFTIQDVAPRAGSEMSISGDLADELPSAISGKEKLVIVPAASTPVPPDPASPVILMGDSHTAVFSEKAGTIKIHTTGAGFRDHLQARFGFPLAVFTNAASGADGARGLLARAAAANPAFWNNRKLVIWCFSAREFTQGRWREVPPKPGK